MSETVEPLSKFRPQAKNVNQHTARGLDLLKQALSQDGYVTPMTATSDGEIIDGSARLEKSAEHFQDEALVIHHDGSRPVIMIRDDIPNANDPRARRISVAVNRIPELNLAYDIPLLEEWRDDISSLFGVGEIDDLLGQQEDPFPVVWVRLSELKEHPRNYREHPPEQIAELQTSLRTHSTLRNLVLARDNTILAGHALVLAAKELGQKRLPALRLNLEPEEPRALKVLLADNEISRLALVDDRALTNLLKEIMQTETLGLMGTGFSEEQLAALVFITRPENEIQDKNEAAEWVGMPELGEVIEPLKLTISFSSESDRALFAEQIQLRIGKKESKHWHTWWPYKEREDLASLHFEDSNHA